MHIEVGGSSGTQVSINDSDIRGLINKSSGAQMSFNEWYGASNVTTESSYSGTSGSATSYYLFEEFIANLKSYGITWSGTAQVTHNGSGSSSTASYDFTSYIDSSTGKIASNTPFPAHSGTIGGWRYFGKRLDAIQYSAGDDYYYVLEYNANRTTSSTYPF